MITSFYTSVSNYENKCSWVRWGYNWGSTIISNVVESVKGFFIAKSQSQLERIERDNKVLYVFIHGLNGSPYGWKQYLSEVEKIAHVNYITYPVPKRGNCGLKEASEGIIDRIRKYILDYETHAICVISTSNGTRIAGRIERKLIDVPIQMLNISISGVHHGTKLINLIKRCKLQGTLNFHEKIIRDYTYNSEVSLERIRVWKELAPQSRGKRKRISYISSNDDKVFPWHSGIVKIANEDEHFICEGYSHWGLKNAVCTNVLKHCKEWVSRYAIDLLKDRVVTEDDVNAFSLVAHYVDSSRGPLSFYELISSDPEILIEMCSFALRECFDCALLGNGAKCLIKEEAERFSSRFMTSDEIRLFMQHYFNKLRWVDDPDYLLQGWAEDFKGGDDIEMRKDYFRNHRGETRVCRESRGTFITLPLLLKVLDSLKDNPRWTSFYARDAMPRLHEELISLGFTGSLENCYYTKEI